VLKIDVDLTALPPRLNPRLVETLKRCLEKNPKKRWHAAADVRNEIEAIMGRAIVGDDERSMGYTPRPLWKRLALGAALLIIGGAIAGYAAWTLKPEPPRPITRFALPLADGQMFTGVARTVLALSPDGTHLAYVVDRRLHLRNLSSLDVRVIYTPDYAMSNPVFSPDGQSIAFSAQVNNSGQIRRIGINGGTPTTICEIPLAPNGIQWDGDDILFAIASRGVFRVPASGGVPQLLAAPKDDEHVGMPQLLPGGNALLYGVKKASTTWDVSEIVVHPLNGGERRTIVSLGADPRYLPTGHLLYAIAGVEYAVRFDRDRLAISGGPVPIIEGIRRSLAPTTAGIAQLAYSQTGTLIYLPGPTDPTAGGNDLAFFDRQGGHTPLKLPPAPYRSPRVSPDGKWVTFASDNDKEATVWVYELSGASAIRRLTFTGRNRAPVWSADGRWIIFQSNREGDLGLFRQRADGSGTPERLTKAGDGEMHIPQSVSPDGNVLLMTVRRDKLFTLELLTINDGRRTPFSDLVPTEFYVEGAFSPDGRWVAYHRGGGGALNGYVEPFPPTGSKYQLPVNGGHLLWSPKGDEIAVNSTAVRSVIVPVLTKPQFGFGPPVTLSRADRVELNPMTERRNVDFMPTGDRLLGVLSRVTGVTSNDEIIVVLNWFEELRARVPR
jgi:dipeptidyl aminopeptidase/acylaminoacyl peptidase